MSAYTVKRAFARSATKARSENLDLILNYYMWIIFPLLLQIRLQMLNKLQIHLIYNSKED